MEVGKFVFYRLRDGSAFEMIGLHGPLGRAENGEGGGKRLRGGAQKTLNLSGSFAPANATTGKPLGRSVTTEHMGTRSYSGSE